MSWQSSPWICAGYGIITQTNYGDSLIPTYGRFPKIPGSSCRLSRGTKYNAYRLTLHSVRKTMLL
jgi:hypothetical protein